MRRTGLMAGAVLLGGILAVTQLPGPEAARGREGGAEDTLELVFTYGSEKETWLKEVTRDFNAAGQKIEGKTIQVTAIPMGSGDCVEEILSGRRQPHLVSPASKAFIVLGNDASKARADGRPLVKETKNLVLSPVILALWKPMAEALGWPGKPIGWAEMRALADSPEGWASRGHPEWGRFKFGHTHPEHSNSGLISILAEVYAGAGKTEELTVEDVAAPMVARFVAGLEKAVVHYGESTGFFGKTMFRNGPDYLSAAVLYENMVIESYAPRFKLPSPLVAIYPKEGTFWSDHPVGIVERDWVKPIHRAAAEKYIAFLLDPEQQKKALRSGFRPGIEEVAVSSPIDREHGVDPREPKRELQPPSAAVIRAGLKVWKENKKNAQVILVLDVSGSMRHDGRLVNARLGARELLKMLGDRDRVGLYAFSSQIRQVHKMAPLRTARGDIDQEVRDLRASGETALYDAIDQAYRYAQQNTQPDRNTAVVVLTDGEDNRSRLKLDTLLRRVQEDFNKTPIRIFCIAYGGQANQKILKEISEATQAESYRGDPETIKKVFTKIAVFF